MDTLLLQLIAPMQSWGVQSLHGDRDSGLEPSKSGVIGLLCAALGRDRADSVADLAALRMGARVDREGKLRKDFQKAEPLNRNGVANGKVVIGDRHYLADAAFLVGLEGEPALLAALQAALERPVYLLYLGRKAFPPAAPVALSGGLRSGMALEQALREYPAVATNAPRQRRVLIEDPRGEMLLHDQPVSFALRRFAPRRVRQEFWAYTTEEACTSPS